MSLIYNALSGAQVAQVALNTTSQNVANAQTAGYSRQGAQLASVGPQGELQSPGNGVEVSSLIRFSDSYKVQQMWSAASNLGQYNAGQSYFTQLEQVMGDDTSSISNGLDGFFSALNAASQDPTSTPLRQQVITAADSLGASINSLNTVLNNQSTSVQQQLGAAVSQVNQLTQSIASLNGQIAAMQSTGGNASALLDTRDQQVNTLAGLVGVSVLDQPDGTLSVSLTNGQPLVISGTSSTLSLTISGTGAPTLNDQFATQTFTSTGANLGGQLGGLADFQQNTLIPLQQSISDIASAVASNVNTQLAAGTDMNGNPGGPLFVYDPTGANGLLNIVSGVQATDLAFSGDGTIGDSGNLQKLIALQNQPITVSSLGTVSLNDANPQLLGQLGTESQKNQALQATAQTVSDQAQNNWASTSGVNTDEEAVNLMQYQQMYEANMKVISVANQLFQSTLQMMG